MSEPPASLALHIAGERVRGVLRLERDPARMRPFFGGLLLFGLCIVYATRGPVAHAPYAFAVSFLVLVATVPFGLVVLNPPRDLTLEAGRLSIGEEEFGLDAIEQIRVACEPRVVRLTLVVGGETYSYPLAEAVHPEEDVRWLAAMLRERAGLDEAGGSRAG